MIGVVFYLGLLPLRQQLGLTLSFLWQVLAGRIYLKLLGVTVLVGVLVGVTVGVLVGVTVSVTVGVTVLVGVLVGV